MNISNNIRKLTQLFIVFFIALSAVLVYWQAVVAQQVATNIHNSRHCLSDSAPVRGRIFDRNGVLLAESKPSNAICGYQRYYYVKNYPSLAGLIGYYISPLYGSSGIERQYDNYLSGRVGVTALNNYVNQTLHRPPVGDDIYLTIDVRLQALLDKYFDQAAPPADGFYIFNTNRGSAIIANPHTGEILAMLSRPTFDPNRIASGDLKYFNSLEKDPEQPLLERPLQSTYIPGSTYKTMTLQAGLDSGSAHLDDPFYNDHDPNHPQALGPVTIGTGNETEVFGPNGNNLEPYTHTFPVALRYGYTHSDNIMFAQVGAKMGASTWLDYNSRFYVGKKIPFDLPVKVSTVAPANGQPLKLNQLAENSFGQGIDSITPLQMTMIDNAIANNGVLMRPSLVLKIVDPSGAIVMSSSPQSLGTPISDNTASQMRDAMYGVVQCGSGKFGPTPSLAPELDTSPWAIIAKTGTGEVPKVNGHTVGAEGWLLTQAPYQNPQLTIVAMKENVGEGGSAVGPMITRTYNDIFSKIMKIPTSPPVDPNYCFTTGLLQ
ncbi:MAG: penicillin-binding protein 2 [Chloroflexi bacterium]|nr:MAG: penicillin-binding protein 2 [Chloroflexota bacterium]